MAWLRRQDLEDRELRELSPWAAHSRDAGGRRYPEPGDPLRTAFARDRDRVIHSRAFRRLQHKTQVLAAYEGDHYRSRMTHSLEVSQMARSVARALGLNQDLAEAIALAHDLGHPPFGHKGEERINQLMADHGGFRHNAQGVRIVDELEDRDGSGAGLNLTLAVRRSLLKGRVPDGFPLSPDLRQAMPLPLEAHVVDLCDRIAYLCHDLDDALRAGIIVPTDVEDLALWRAVADHSHRRVPNQVISDMTSLLIHDLVESSAASLERALPGAPPPRLGPTPGVTVMIQELLVFLREHFYRAQRVMVGMAQGCDRIAAVFNHLCSHPEELPERMSRRVVGSGLERTVCDYVAGMTDRFLLNSQRIG